MGGITLPSKQAIWKAKEALVSLDTKNILQTQDPRRQPTGQGSRAPLTEHSCSLEGWPHDSLKSLWPGHIHSAEQERVSMWDPGLPQILPDDCWKSWGSTGDPSHTLQLAGKCEQRHSFLRDLMWSYKWVRQTDFGLQGHHRKNSGRK